MTPTRLLVPTLLLALSAIGWLYGVAWAFRAMVLEMELGL